MVSVVLSGELVIITVITGTAGLTGLALPVTSPQPADFLLTVNEDHQDQGGPQGRHHTEAGQQTVVDGRGRSATPRIFPA